MITRVAVWASYSETDATAWVVLTDTINDIILAALHKHDTSIGSYTLGNIGSALQLTSRFAQKYPRLYAATDQIHGLRLAADLAHPVTRSTNLPTSRIPWKEMKKLKPKLAGAYLELWTKW
jgi:urate oxidase